MEQLLNKKRRSRTCFSDLLQGYTVTFLIGLLIESQEARLPVLRRIDGAVVEAGNQLAGSEMRGERRFRINCCFQFFPAATRTKKGVDAHHA